MGPGREFAKPGRALVRTASSRKPRFNGETKEVKVEFLVKIHKGEYGYDVVCPTLKGCASQGDTEEKALKNIKDAIREYLLAVQKVHKDEKIVRVEVSV